MIKKVNCPRCGKPFAQVGDVDLPVPLCRICSVEVKLKGKDKWQELSKTGLKEQIAVRNFLIQNVLVGNLYPRILQSEIRDLQELYDREIRLIRT